MAADERRVTSHIILGDLPESEMVTILVDGKPMQARKGEMILAALLAEGIIINRYTAKRHEPRGLFCGIGQCTDCMMTVNGVPNIRTCITPVEDGMTVETQDGLGEWRVVNERISDARYRRRPCRIVRSD